jgi:uncharacterized membrane protein
MDGLIILLILIPVIFLIFLVAILSKASLNQQTLDAVKSKLDQLRDQLYDLETQMKDLTIARETDRIIAPPKKEDGETHEKPATTTETIPKTAEEEQVPVEERKIWRPGKIFVAEDREEFIPSKEHVEQAAGTLHSEAPPPAGETPVHTETDWEKFIGENLANKIGITVLVLGISFFVKFAIDKNWINETGRVIIGLISGAALIGLAHFIRNAYRSFSSVLVGGGLTVFYFTIAFAFHQYHLISQEVAFFIMVVITAFAVGLSIFYNRLELAVLATIGGFVTPFLVSTGQNNYVALFTYLCILNSGLLVLSWFKRWKAINVIALSFTVIIYGSWLIRQLNITTEPFPHRWAFFFASLFYILSVAINIVNNLKLKIPFGAFDFILLLVINFLYYAAGIIILQYWGNGEYKGLFTASLGVLNLFLTLAFFRQKRVDRNFIHLLTGLAIAFISLAAPVQLKGNAITLFWAAETVVLFWLYQRSRMVLLKIASLFLLFPLLISLFMDWSQVYGESEGVIPLFINKGFVTTITTSIALLIYHRLMRKETEKAYLPVITNGQIRGMLLVSAVLLAYAAGAWETYYQFLTRLPDTYIYAAYLQLYSFAFALLVLVLFKKSRSFILLKFGVTISGFILYLFNLRINYMISLDMLTTGSYSGHFFAHWLSAALLTWLLYDLVIYFRRQKNIMRDYAVPFTWIASAALVFLLSVEMYHAILWLNYRDAEDWDYWENLYYKAGLSILWGLCSFAMMWLGMKYRFRTLRIISLTLFTITLVKLFIYDIQNIPPGGKIAAFILLGILLLIVSFMYQRLKKMILDDPEKA